MSLFDRYVQVKHLSNQEALSRQNRAILHATAAQNAHLEALQNQLEQANQQQQQLLRYQKAQHAAREHQKFLKDAVFTINEILSYVESIEDRNAQFAVLMGCYSTVHDLLGQTIDQLEEIHDKVAASKLKEKLVYIKNELEKDEVAFQNSEIGKYMAAKMKYEELAGPLLVELDDLTPEAAKPALPHDIIKNIEKHSNTTLIDFNSEGGRKLMADYGEYLSKIAKKRLKTFRILAFSFPAVFFFALMLGTTYALLPMLQLFSIPIFGIRAWLASIRKKTLSTESDKFFAEYAKWTILEATNSARKNEITQILQRLESEYPHHQLAEKMLARYPKILEQMAAPAGKLAALFEKWGVED